MPTRNNKSTIHFIGIGGIGMSALARWFLHEGHRVSGSDTEETPLIRTLRKEGITVTIGHRASAVSRNVDRVIYSNAVSATGKQQNSEIKKARKENIPLQSYPEALGERTREKFTIAVCGTHGKSTTTGLAGVLLQKAGFDPTVIVGAEVPEFNHSNFRYGSSDFLVIEADEFKDAFLAYSPDIVLWTAFDWDHIDYFKTFYHVKRSFRTFLSRVPKEGYIIANGDEAHVRNIIQDASHNTTTLLYSHDMKEHAYVARHVRLLGEHNIMNALSVLLLARVAGISQNTLTKTLKRFSGVHRRLERKGTYRRAILFDDYAHHPAEVEATLAALRHRYRKRLQNGKLWCIYQLHQLERTKHLFHAFTRAFHHADGVLLLDIYRVAGREKQLKKTAVHAKNLSQEITHTGTPAIYVPDIASARRMMKRVLRARDVVVVMGAGDVWKIWDRFPFDRGAE